MVNNQIPAHEIIGVSSEVFTQLHSRVSLFLNTCKLKLCLICEDVGFSSGLAEVNVIAHLLIIIIYTDVCKVITANQINIPVLSSPRQRRNELHSLIS